MSGGRDQLAFLLDCDDLAVVEAKRPEALSGRLMVMDIDLHLHLLERGIEHLTPWDIVSRDEYAALRRFDADILAFWEHAARASYEGLDCLRMARYRHVCCFTRLAWAAYVIRRTMEALRPRTIVTFEERTGHGLDQPAGCRKMPLLFALVRGMAELAGVSVRLLRRTALGGEPGFIDRVAPASEIRLPPIEVERFVPAGEYVLFSGSGLDLTRQLPVIRALRREGMPVAQVYKSADEAALERLRAEGHPLWHESQITADQLRIADCGLRILGQEARCRFESARAYAAPALQCIFANRYLDTHFDFIFGDYLERMMGHVQTWTSFFARLRPALLVANYPAPIIDVAHHLGIPCLILSHGLMILGDTRIYQGQPPVMIGAISEAHRSRLLEAGFDAQRVHVTGDPGADEAGSWHGHPARETMDWKPMPPLSQRAAHPSPLTTNSSPLTKRRILLVTGELSAPFAKACLPEVDFAAAARCVDQLAELIEMRTDWDFTIKCHPRYDHPALYQRLNRRLPEDRRAAIHFDQPLAKLVHESDAVVFPNARSSALLEASMGDRPVILLDTCMIWFDHAWWGTDQWPRVRSVADLERLLAELFRDSDRYQACVRQTRAALACSLGDGFQPSADRCANLIRQSWRIAAASPTISGRN